VPILQNRVYLMGLIAAFTIIATIVPFILGHVVTLEIIEHQIIHVTAITFGVFLTIISIHSSMISKNSRMVWTTLAFVTFTLLSIYLLFEDMEHDRIHESASLITDVVLTIMIGFFAIGVFWNNSYKTDEKEQR
tara:strand:- start:200 stop:601 length:402 start_codon:yes stop_codon:yes gene_type:complete